MEHYKKALVIGAGSGRDMASALYITQKLRRNNNNCKIDLCGFLTPWAIHIFEDHLERPINELSEKGSRKFILYKENRKYLDSYFEPELYRLNKEYELGIENMYLFSLHYGINTLQREFNQLIEEKEYDTIILVDVGGDILADERHLESIYTPIVDLSSLKILSNVPHNIKKYLVVISPGVDGELSCSQITSILKDLREKKILLSEERIEKESEEYRIFVRINHKLNERTKSYSHTVRVIENLINHKKDINTNYIKTLQLYDKTWRVSFNVYINYHIASKIYYIDVEKLCKNRAYIDRYYNYANIPELVYTLLRKGVRGTEVDLRWIPKKLNEKGYRDCTFIKNTFKDTPSEIKKEIINYINQIIK